jgi:hypothetical protein
VPWPDTAPIVRHHSAGTRIVGYPVRYTRADVDAAISILTMRDAVVTTARALANTHEPDTNFSLLLLALHQAVTGLEAAEKRKAP